MKRLLLLAAVGAAASLLPAPAQANHHLCVTREGRDVVCVPYLDFISREQICVTSAGRPVACV